MTNYTQYAIELYRKQGYKLVLEIDDTTFGVEGIRSKVITNPLKVLVLITHEAEELTPTQVKEFKDYWTDDNSRVDICKIVLDDKGGIKYTKIITNVLGNEVY